MTGRGAEEISRISLVVMTHERPAALLRCIDSIARLTPPASVFEVVVVDDGSTQRPAVPLDRRHPALRLRYHWMPHRGVAAARNAGLELSQGELVAFLADDYVLPADYLSRVEAFFDRCPDAEILTFNVRCVSSSAARHVQQLYTELVLLKNAGAIPDEHGVIRTFGLPASRAAVFRRRVFERVGRFDERLSGGEDGELGRRLTAHGIPQHFLHEVYVDHHEDKSFAEFLRQRREYATYTYRLSSPKLPGEGARWPVSHCVHLVAERLVSGLRLSRRYGKLTRFLLLWPGLVLFLLRFYLTLHRLEASEARAPQPAVRRSRRRNRRRSTRAVP